MYRDITIYPNDTPGPVPGGCGRAGCCHANDDHYATGYRAPWEYSSVRPCNVRGERTHCVCYDYLPPSRGTAR